MSRSLRARLGFQSPWRLFVGLAALLGLLGLLPLAAVAEDDDEAEDERQEAIERHTERGWKAWRGGNHEEVFARMERLQKVDPEGTLAPYLIARTQFRTGKYEEAQKTLTEAQARFPDERRLNHVSFRMLELLSRHDELATAAQAATQRDPKDVVAWVYLGAALEGRGKRKEALAAYDKVVELHNARALQKTDVPWVARAAVRATWLSPLGGDDMIDGANKMLQRYVRDNPDDIDALFAIAEFFRADRGSRGQSRASKSLRTLVRQNSEHPDARVARARIALVFYKQSDALRELERARRVNPNHPEALAVEAAIHIGNGYYDRAVKMLDRAQKVAPNDRYARSVRAAMHWIRGDKAAFETEREGVFDYDPTYSAFYRTCAELVGERQRRYDVAADLARKAIEIDPRDHIAHVIVGEALMNVGETDEALEQFGKAYKLSKTRSDVHRDNWRDLLQNVMPTFRTFKSENFVVRMPRGEARVMEHYLMPLLEESKRDLEKHYGFKVTTPIYVDAFDIDQDFSVRSVGTPGLPALGVCFGRVVTLLGPTSKPMGEFSWSRTTWHEFAHVVTLQMSGGQVPRWLTEGLSVFEEQRHKAIWGRDMQRELFDRYHNDRLLRMGKINEAFRGPDILFAYYQGGLISEHLTKDRGFEVIPKMLLAFKEDKTTAQVFKDVLGLELAKYDTQFRAFVGEMIKDYKLVPRWDRKSMASFRDRTKKDPNDVEAWARLAWGHFQRKREIDAGDALSKARKINADHPEVILLLARLAQQGGRDAAAAELYEKYFAAGHDDFEARRYLARRATRQDSDPVQAIEHWTAAAKAFPPYAGGMGSPRRPGKGNPYRELAKLYRGKGDVKASIEQLETYARVAPRSMGVRRELRRWYRKQEDWAALARVCEEMIDVSPFGGDIKARPPKPPDLELHRLYATALAELEKSDLRLRELRVQVELGRLLPEKLQIEQGVVDDLLVLGEALYERGNMEEALEQAVAALRLDPQNEKARILKGRSMEEGNPR